MDKEKKGTLFAVISASTFGTEAIIVKLLYACGVNTITLLIFRYIFAVLFIWFFVVIKKINVLQSRQLLKKLLFLGLFLVPLPTTFLMYSFNYIAAPVGIICLYFYPVFVTIWSALIFKEKITAKKAISLLLALCGLVLVIGIPAGTLNTLGIFFALLAALTNSVVVIINSRIVRNIDPILANAYYMTASVITFTLAGLFMGQLDVGLGAVEVLYLLVLALLSTVIPHFTFLLALKYTDASRVSITSMLEPVVTAILAAFILQEILTGLQVVGGMLVLAGIWLLQKKKITHKDDCYKADNSIKPASE